MKCKHKWYIDMLNAKEYCIKCGSISKENIDIGEWF